jgi:type I restriction enzyme M protein
MDLKNQSDAEFTGEPYSSRFEGVWVPPEHRDKKKQDQKPFEVDKKTLRWSEFKHYHAEEMLTHVQTRVFPFLKDMNGAESGFTHHMKNAVFIIPKPGLLVEAVKTIDEIFRIMEKDSVEKGQAFQDIQGDVYEYLLSEIASAGKNGQFRTPRHIIKLIAELVKPRLGNRIGDPACGTGGFLLGAYQYIVTDIARKTGRQDLKPDEDGFVRTSVSAAYDQNSKAILDKSLFGYDIDSTMIRLGMMNLMMHGIDEPLLDYKDTLSKGFNEPNQYQIIMANPPFTGSIDKSDINEDLTLSTTKTELLFVETMVRMLRKGGTAGVIVPQGVLFGSGKAFVAARQILVDRCELKAVITMPSGVFKPYAGVSTAILVFTKVYDREDKVTEPATQNVWFYEMASDGYSLDDRRNKLDTSGDLQDIVEKFNTRAPDKDTDRKNPKGFFVPYQEIKDEKYDLSPSRYKEMVFEEIDYEKPSVILERLIANEVGEMEEKDLAKVEGGIVRELLALKGMVE